MKASELIQELVMQIAQYGDMDINVMVKGAYHGNVSVSTSCKDEAKYNFMTVHGSGDFYGKMEGGGGEEGFYDDDDEKPSNEGFYLDEKGRKRDAAFFADD